VAAHASLIESLDTNAFIAESPGDELIARLEDPKIASSISLILDHADLLATLIVGLDGLIRRADTIGDSLASGVADARELAASAGGLGPWPKLDLAGLSDTVTRLSAALVDATPAIDRLMHSSLTDPQTADILAEVGEALLEGKQAAAADPRGPKGIFALMKVTKDPDVSRGLGFMIHIARAFGRRLDVTSEVADKPGARHSAP
jgi:hypothetical protein